MDAIIEKAKSIRLLILDVDGVLTSGFLRYSNQGIEVKDFYVHDGLGIKLLQKSGLTVAIISGKHSEVVADRAKEIGIEHCYLGHDNKLPAYEKLKKTLQLSDQQIAYMGDDLPDLPLLRRAGLAISVPQAPNIIHKHVDFITTRSGGKGAVREVCELILQAQGTYQSMIESFLM